MKRFMAVYTGSPAGREGYEKRFPHEEERKANDRKGMEAWMQWARKHAASIVDVRNNLAAYTLVEAESHEAAAKMFVNHPHFTIFPGDGVEIMECLPIPERG